MAKKKTAKMAKREKELREAGFYKGYDINWLRKNPDHPDFYLVEEFEGK